MSGLIFLMDYKEERMIYDYALDEINVNKEEGLEDMKLTKE